MTRFHQTIAFKNNWRHLPHHKHSTYHHWRSPRAPKLGFFLYLIHELACSCCLKFCMLNHYNAARTHKVAAMNRCLSRVCELFVRGAIFGALQQLCHAWWLVTKHHRSFHSEISNLWKPISSLRRLVPKLAMTHFLQRQTEGLVCMLYNSFCFGQVLRTSLASNSSISIIMGVPPANQGPPFFISWAKF